MWQPSSGANDIPLGTKRLVSDAPMNDESHNKRARPSDDAPSAPLSAEERAERRRKRKSRWGSTEDKVTALPTTLPKLDNEKKTEYILKIRLEEINRRLRSGDVVPDERQRSPSPEPVYDSHGKRVNTREVRYRKKLEDERHKLVTQALKDIPGFVPPADYRRPDKLQEKVYIPDKEFPEINFMGLLIGPRGKTLKSLESETGVKISIRGRGSVKEGKSRAEGGSSEDDLHCLVMADEEYKIKAAIKRINKIIETAASTPEGQNDLKRNQLRELAALNGTLRDDEAQTCLQCGEVGHRRFECPQRPSFSSSLTCHKCGGLGHIARDCHEQQQPYNNRTTQLDAEYMNLMAELGEHPEGAPPAGAPPNSYGGDHPPPRSSYHEAPPPPPPVDNLPDDAPYWMRDPDLANAPWHNQHAYPPASRAHQHSHRDNHSHGHGHGHSHHRHQQSHHQQYSDYDANAYYYGGGYDYNSGYYQQYPQGDAQGWDAPPPPPPE
ncbi:hypothetical protein BC940DRAFT_311349 [Gongronella butleri]|nr:hypothetical protein BC940DRAFT_311349 [Gongronella butleri]